MSMFHSNGHRWPQVLVRPAECGWPVFPFRKLEGFWRFCQVVSHALHPVERGRRIAPRIPPSQPRELVGLCIGSLVSWLLGLWQQISPKQVCKWLFGGLVVASKGLSNHLSCHIGFDFRWQGPIDPKMAKEGLQEYFGSSDRCVAALLGHILGPSWAILGPPWPFSGVQEAIFRPSLGLEGLILGCKVAES